MSQIINKWLSDESVDSRVLSTTVAGWGISKDVNQPLYIEPDDLSGAGIAPVYVSANGVGVHIDNDTIIHDDGMLYIRPGGIGSTEINEGDDYDWTGIHNFNNYAYINVTPTDNYHIVNKQYVDAVATGLDWKDSVKVATDAALPTYTYANGTAGVGATITGSSNGALPSIDGVALTTGDRILVKDESGAGAAVHGIYEVTQLGDGSTPYILTRTPDANGEVTDGNSNLTSGMATFVEEGTTNGDTAWVLTTNDPINVGSTLLTYVQFTGTGLINAGDALRKDGNSLHVNDDDVTIGINGSNELYVKDNAIGPDQIQLDEEYNWTGLHVFNYILPQSNIVPVDGDDLVNKDYVDAIAQGLVIKDAVRLSSNDTDTGWGSVTASYVLGTETLTLDGVDAGTTYPKIDGIEVAVGDRVLIKDAEDVGTGADAEYNGIYDVDVASDTNTLVLVRASDFATGSSAGSAYAFVEEGNINDNSGWVVTNVSPNDVVDTDAIYFTLFSNVNQIDAGVGLIQIGDTFHIGGTTLGPVNGIDRSTNDIAAAVDNSTIEINGSGRLQVKEGGINSTHIDEGDDYNWEGLHTFNYILPQTDIIPVNDEDIVNKAYVDSIATGLQVLDSVQASTTSNINVTTDLNTGDTIDGYVLQTGDRVLVKNQTNGVENGIYEVQGVAAAATRTTDYSTGEHVASTYTFVENGTANGDSGWVNTNTFPSDVVDTDVLTYTIFSNVASISGGTGLTKVGNTMHIGDGSTGNIDGITRTVNNIAVAVDNETIYIKGDGEIAVKDGGITKEKLADGSTFIETITLVAGDITNEYASLSKTPEDTAQVVLDIVSGCVQRNGVDYDAYDSGPARIDWDGKGLDGVLEVGDVLVVTYTTKDS